ncbi:SpoIVB peptidase [Thermovenabulum sp.]|uniref:SpoIVB peptidase n=1 Tax=Thermovenabulum sp. TaxID=3100335 RepID=UPI003C7C1B1C
MKWKKRQIIGLTLSVLIILFYFLTNTISLPERLSLIEGKEQKISIKVPFTFEILCENGNNLLINGEKVQDFVKINLRNPVTIQSAKLGSYNLEWRLFGVIPVKKTRVEVIPQIEVVPGGHSIGVKLKPNGVIVVGTGPISDEKGKTYIPAKEAGIEMGDTILKANGIYVYTAEDLSTIINNDDDKIITLTIKRNGAIFDVNVKAMKNRAGIYQLGLWVRDITAGVGTLTFYHPATRIYAALGHIISDSDTGKIIEIGNGEIIRAKITSILPAKKNIPGEKRGVFVKEEEVIGNILENNNFGIFGQIYEPLENPYYGQIPVAPSSYVHPGKAEILTVVEGERIERYEVEILRVYRQEAPSPKSMVIKITDPRLLSRTGGIVQGMSGSPIIQDGFLVGAITHVFVNDPTKGYGVFAEWMLKEIVKINENIP